MVRTYPLVVGDDLVVLPAELGPFCEFVLRGNGGELALQADDFAAEGCGLVGIFGGGYR